MQSSWTYAKESKTAKATKQSGAVSIRTTEQWKVRDRYANKIKSTINQPFFAHIHGLGNYFSCLRHILDFTWRNLCSTLFLKLFSVTNIDHIRSMVSKKQYSLISRETETWKTAFIVDCSGVKINCEPWGIVEETWILLPLTTTIFAKELSYVYIIFVNVVSSLALRWNFWLVVVILQFTFVRPTLASKDCYSGTW